MSQHEAGVMIVGQWLTVLLLVLILWRVW